MKPIFILLVLAAVIHLGCKNGGSAATDPKPEAWSPAQLVKEYEQGEVNRCVYNGETVFFGARNAPDGGSEAFNSKGEKIGVCYYNTGMVDPVCKGATNCETIYRVHPNIWGKPGVEFAGK